MLRTVSHASSHFISHYTSCYYLFHFTDTEFERSSRWWLTQASYALFFLLMTWELEPHESHSCCWGGGGCLSSAWQIWRGWEKRTKYWRLTSNTILATLSYALWLFWLCNSNSLPHGKLELICMWTFPTYLFPFYFKTGVQLLYSVLLVSAVTATWVRYMYKYIPCIKLPSHFFLPPPHHL